MGEVGPGVAGLQVRGGARAVDEQGEEQQPHVVRCCGDHHAHCTDSPDGVSEAEARAATAGLADGADDQRRERRAEGEQGRGQSGQAGGAEHPLRQQGTDGDARSKAGTGQDLGDDQHGEDAPLLGRGTGLVGEHGRDASALIGHGCRYSVPSMPVQAVMEPSMTRAVSWREPRSTHSVDAWAPARRRRRARQGSRRRRAGRRRSRRPRSGGVGAGRSRRPPRCSGWV